MMCRLLWLGCVALALSACRKESEGTFIGNPSLTVRLADNSVQRIRSARLEAEEVYLGGCNDGEAFIGETVFDFDDALSGDKVQFPEGQYCTVNLQVRSLVMTFQEVDQDSTTIFHEDFTVELSVDFLAETGDEFALVLGNENWLAAIAAATGPGDHTVGAGNSELDTAFTDGTENGSSVEPVSEAPSSDSPGRIDLDEYSTSPNGQPLSVVGCGPGVNIDLAVPIPPAAMATLGHDGAEVGWCEGPVDFPDPMEEQLATQIDYSDLSTYEILYHGWGQSCGAIHCGSVKFPDGSDSGRPCSVLAFCDNNIATVTGFHW